MHSRGAEIKMAAVRGRNPSDRGVVLTVAILHRFHMPRTLPPILRPLTLLLAIAVLGGCHNPYKEGMEAFKAGRLGAAEREALAGLDEEPRDPKLNLLYAEVLVAQEKWADAARPARIAAEGLPKNVRAQLLFAEVLVDQQSWIAAADAILAGARADAASTRARGDFVSETLTRGVKEAFDSDLPEKAALFLEGLRDLAGAEVSDELERAHTAAAQKLFRRGKYSDAAAAYERLAEEYPEVDTHWLELGTLYLYLDRVVDAKAAFARYTDGAKGRPGAERHDQIAERAVLAAQFDTAVEAWRQACALDPDWDGVHRKLADLLYRRKSDEEAFQVLEASLGAKPTPSRFLLAARVASDRAKGDVAIELLSRGLAEAAPDYGLATELASLLLRRERRGDAEAALAAYLERLSKANAPDTVQRMSEVAAWLEGRGELDLALTFTGRLLERQDAPAEAHLTRARLLGQRGRRSDAVESVERYVSASGGSAEAVVAAARLLMELRTPDVAARMLLTALRKNPSDASLTGTLAEVYYGSGQLDKEDTLWTKWVRAQDDKGAAALTVGRRYDSRGDVARALRYLTQATQSPEHAAAAWLAIGTVQQRRGSDREMRAAFEAYVKAAPDEAEALRSLLPRFSGPSGAAMSIELLERLLALAPDDVDRRFDLGRRLYYAGEHDRALEQLLLFVEKSPKPVTAARRAGEVFSRNHRDLSLAVYDALLAKHGDNKALYGELGSLYWDLSRSYHGWSEERTSQFREAAQRYLVAYIDNYQPAAKGTPEAKERRLTRLAQRLSSTYRLDGLAVRAFARARELGLKLNARDQLRLGVSHLRLGDIAAAKAAFDAHLRGSKDPERRFLPVAREAFNHEAFDLALGYLAEVVKKRVSADLDAAFGMQVDILLRQGRKEDIRAVSLAALRASRSRFGVRLSVGRAYARAGLWEDAIREYEALMELKPGDPIAIRRVADAAYRSGDRDRAQSLFEEAAKVASNSGKAWTELGIYYFERGEFTAAAGAFRRGVAEGGGSRAKVHLGVVLSLQGEFAEAQTLLAEGLAETSEPDRDYELAVAGLASTPRRDLAEAFGREGLGLVRERGDLLGLLATYELRRGDVPRGLRDAEAWSQLPGNRGTPFVRLLLEEGQGLEALEVLRREVERGDHILAEAMLFGARSSDRTLLEVALDTGGLERFPLLFRPLLERREQTATLHESLGLVYAERERDIQATIHLKAAAADGPRHSDYQLGRVRLSRGEEDLARASFTRFVNSYEEPGARRNAVWYAVMAYLIHGDGAGAEVFARSTLAADGEGTVFVPVLTEVLLVRGRSTQALDLVRNGPLANLFTAPVGGRAATGDAGKMADLLEAVRRLSEYGYGREATSMLVSVAQARPEQAAVSLALVELLSRHELPGADVWAQKYLSLGLARAERTEELELDVADAFLRGGSFPAAADAYAKAVADHSPGVARRGLGGLLTVALQSHDPKAADEAIAAYRKARGNRLDGARDAASLLMSRGAFRRAHKQLGEALRLAPIDSGTRAALVRSGHLSGADDVVESAQAFERLGGDGASTRVEFGRLLARGPRPGLARNWWARVAKEEPANVLVALERARAFYLLGQDAEGRSAIGALLDMSGGDRVALEEALELLAQLRQWSDLLALSAEGRQAGEGGLSARGWLYVGAAHYALGNRKDALAAFDRYTAKSSDPVWTHLEVARVLRAAAGGADGPRALEDALTYCQRAHEASPEAPLPFLARGEIKLRRGDKNAALKDFDRYLARGGHAHSEALAHIGQWLLEGGHGADGARYLLRLSRMPGYLDTGGLKLALAAYENAGQFRPGLQFLRTHFPDLARNPQVGGLEVAVASLHQGAGDVPAAVAIYEAAMVRRPQASVFKNNLAYLLAESGRDLDRAERLAHEALGTPSVSDYSRGTYLDTLAWIHRKQGKLDEARLEQEMAIRLVGSSQRDLEILFTHLADIHEQRGDAESAAIAKRQAGLHDAAAAPFLPGNVGFEVPNALLWRTVRGR